MTKPPSERVRLTKRTIDRLTCPPGRKDMLVFDAELKGFALRVTAPGAGKTVGSKVFLFQYRAGGPARRVVLGEYGVITPDEARAQAEVLRGQVKAGKDPKAEHDRERRAEAVAVAEAQERAAADALTFGVLVERWRDIHLANRRESYRNEASRSLLVSLAAWKDRPAHRIRPAEAVAVLDDIAAERGPAAARSAFSNGRSMFAWAVKRQMVPGNPFVAIQAPEAVPDRDRALTDAELGEVWRAAEGLGWPMGDFTRMAILTLQRREEVAGMRWAELASDLSTWTLPGERAKNGKAHVVHLAPAARAILKGAQRIKGSPFVFTTTGETHVSSFSRSKARLDAAIAAARKKAGAEPPELAPWRLHDMRRTGVTRLAALGFPPHVCDRLLNHVQGAIQGVAAIYQRHEFLPERKAALEAWAKHVLAVAKGGSEPEPKAEDSAEVVRLDGARRRKIRG